jgi:hypothetical protein
MNEVMLALGFFVVALLYASVGHGGATGYLALLALVVPTLPHHEAATVEEARQIVLQAATPLGIEWVSLPEAVGRVLAEPVIAPHDLPPFDNAAMDGYAIRAADAPLGLPLRIVGEADAVVPEVEGRLQPLHALYRREVAPRLAEFFSPSLDHLTDSANPEKKILEEALHTSPSLPALQVVIRTLRLRLLTPPEWQTLDPEGISFRNWNTPD